MLVMGIFSSSLLDSLESIFKYFLITVYFPSLMPPTLSFRQILKAAE